MFQLLEAYNRCVENLEHRPHRGLRCGCSADQLKARQLLRRKVRFLEDFLVHTASVLVMLWTCVKCHRSFRHLPPFLKRHKRFITPSILEKATKVLSKKRQPYRSTVRTDPPRKRPILYAQGDGSAMAHTSVWRWIQWMGNYASKVLSLYPKMAQTEPEESFEYSEFQAVEPRCRENLYLARRCWKRSFLDLEIL